MKNGRIRITNYELRVYTRERERANLATQLNSFFVLQMITDI